MGVTYSRRKTPTDGIYFGEVVSAKDPSMNGRLKVYIPALHKKRSGQAKRGGDGSEEATFNCIWTSPYAGGTNYADENINMKEDYRGSLKSYGLWMHPPDIGTQVVVAFGQGNLKYGVILSCLFPEDRTYMVPGAAGSPFNYQKLGYRLPVSEKNKFDNLNPEMGTDVLRPAHLDHARAVYQQGLLGDGIRGPSLSSARRESPSSVFGILTPGAFNKADTEDMDLSFLGKQQVAVPGNRSAGHSFVMDDGDANGQSKNIRIRTGGGNQILLDDNEGIIYFINKNGKAWMELDQAGGITLFGEGSVDIRAKGNFNLRADRNVNIEAGGDVNIKAAGDTATGDGDQYVGLQPIPGLPSLGYGGSVRVESVQGTSVYSGTSTQITSIGGDIDINSAGRTAITGGTLGVDVFAGTGGIKMLSAVGGIHLNSSLGINLTSTAPISLAGLPVLLNSPGGIPAMPALPATTASSIGTNKHEDWSSDMPKFGDMEDGLMPNTTVENASGRKKGPTISSIVSTMPTAEPYLNHAKSDALLHNQNSMSEEDYDDDLGPNDADSPDGYQGG